MTKKHLIHYLLLMTFSVFVLTSNVHAMDMALADSQTQQTEMSDMHHSHAAMADCEQSSTPDNDSCCDCDCLMSHCHKSQSLVPDTAINLIQHHAQQNIELIIAVTEHASPPRKRPPKA